MNVRIRIKRILEPLRGFRYVKNETEAPVDLRSANLGRVIGCYDNEEKESGDIWIYEDGLMWQMKNELHPVRFDEIAQVVVPNEKRSVHLHFVKGNGQVLIWPFDGNDGMHFDSLEMVRFLDRVMADIRDAKK